MHDEHDRLDWTRVGGSVLLLTSGAVLSLLLLGRTPWGTAAGPGLWTGNIHGALNSQRLADPFTLIHFTHGLVLFLGLLAAVRRWSATGRFVAAYALEACWEVAENTAFAIETFRREGLRQGYYGDSILNSVGDLGAAGIGVVAATALAARRSRRTVLILTVGLEVGAWLWIQESVLLIAGRLVLKGVTRVGG